MASYGLPQLRLQNLMQNGYDPFVQQQQPQYQDDPGYDTMPQYEAPQPQQAPSYLGPSMLPTVPDGLNKVGATQGAPPPQMSAPTVPNYDPNAAIERTIGAVNRVFTPDTQDRDRLRTLMDAAPERESPGWGRGLAAIGVGLGTKDMGQALANMEAVNYAPHRRAMADWTAKADPFYKTAELENRQNVNERTLAGNIVTNITASENAASRERIAEDRNRIAMVHAKAAELRAGRAKTYIDGDRVIAITADNRKIDLGPSRGMSEEDSIRLKGTYDVAAARESAQGADRRAATGQAREFTDKEGNTWMLKPGSEPGAPPTTEKTDLPPGSTPSAAPRSAGSGGGQLEQNRVEQNRAQNYWEVNNEKARRRMYNENGVLKMKPRPVVKEGGWLTSAVTQADVDEWDEVKMNVDPTYNPPPKPKPTAAPPKAAAPPKPASSEPFPMPSTGGVPVPKFGSSNTSPKGLEPSTIPSAAPPSQVPSNAWVQKDPKDPNKKRMSTDGGKTWQYSTDGGRTWNRGGV